MVEINKFSHHPLLRRALTALLIVLAFSPALFIARLIFRCGVDIPYADEWTWVPFLFSAHEHSLTVADLFSQHNEHRYFFPKLILLVLAPLTSGNTQGAMFFSFGVVLLTSGALWYLLSKTVNTTLNKRLLLLGLLNLVLFSPVQAENWTWGFQFVLFLTNFLLVAGICVAVSQRPLSMKFLFCLGITIVATFSFGGGIVGWLATFPLALVLEPGLAKKRIILWLSAWLCAAAAAVALYFFHYIKPPHHPPLGASLNPVDYFLYITTFLGGHLAKAARTESIVVAVENGTLLLFLYFGGLILAVRRRSETDFRQRMLPWLTLGGLALLNAILAAATRIGFGLNQGLDSRYTTFSLYISLSVIGLFAVIMSTKVRLENYRPEFSRGRWLGTAWLLTACPTLLLLGHVHATWWGIGSMQEARQNRLHGKAALLFANVLDAGDVYSRYLIANAVQVGPWAKMANSLGYIHPPLFEGPELSRISQRPQQAGFFESIVTRQDGTCEATGWAIIPKKMRPADGILLAYDDPGKGPIIFAIASPTKPRPEVVDALHDPRYEYAGWSCEFARSRLPAGDQRITAWSFDAERIMVYPLITPQTVQ